MILESSKYIAIPPGETIKELLSDRGISENIFAERMQMTKKQVDELLEGDVPLTLEIASRLEVVLGVPANFWSRLELIYQNTLANIKKRRLKREKISK